ncbi:hypothetical protein KSP39_PZI012104 [Platanthera zijinensis]|uniref:AB hydrolase-1 domain-containing protein n=1 Tax=Platanthera zijinensis TaxID=2320716 RepID=A0AAP0BE58_9ASPA
MPVLAVAPARCGGSSSSINKSLGTVFPPFLPKEVERIVDPSARELAMRIQRVPVKLWRSHIQRPIVLVGPSLGAAVAIDFAVNHPETVTRLVLIDASVYAEGTGHLSKLPRLVAYAGVALLKSIPLRLYANLLAFNKISLGRSFDCVNIGRLHCLLPWWEDATVNFMVSGGYDVRHQIKQVKQKTLILWGEKDRIVNTDLALRLHDDLPNSVLHQVPDCGHLPHVEKPEFVVESISNFISGSMVDRPTSSALEAVPPS